VIFKTPADCGIKMKVVINLLHRNGVFLPLPIFFAFSVVFEFVEVWLLKLLMLP